MNKFLAITAAAAAIVAANPAMAASFTFDTTTGGSNSSTTYGNVRTYSKTTGTETLSMKATAWSMSTANTVSSAYLGSYSTGLGVINRNEGSGSGNTHTIDNQSGEDFILLQFSQAVTLTSTILNAYGVGTSLTDTDTTIAWGNLGGAWSQALNLSGQTEANLGKIFSGTVNVAGNGTGTQKYSIVGAGNLWLIGASNVNADRITDGFKLASLTVAAVPEPATWAMMLVGFGMVAAASRYRRRNTNVAYA